MTTGMILTCYYFKPDEVFEDGGLNKLAVQPKTMAEKFENSDVQETDFVDGQVYFGDYTRTQIKWYVLDNPLSISMFLRFVECGLWPHDISNIYLPF